MSAASLDAGFSLGSDAGLVAGSLVMLGGQRSAVFTPATLLARDTVYTVTVAAAVVDQAGLALGSAATSTFTTRDVDWGPAVAVQGAGGVLDHQPKLVTDGTSALLVFRDRPNDGGTDRVMATQWGRALDGGSGSWLPASVVSPSGSSATAALNGSSAVVGWADVHAGPRPGVAVSRLVGSTWSAAVFIDNNLADIGSTIEGPRIALASNGTALAVWSQVVTGTRLVYFARMTAGGAWTAPASLAASVITRQSTEPRLVMDTTGAALFSREFDLTSAQVMLRKYNLATSTFSAPQVVGPIVTAISGLEVSQAGGGVLVSWLALDGVEGLRSVNVSRFTGAFAVGATTVPRVLDSVSSSLPAGTLSVPASAPLSATDAIASWSKGGAGVLGIGTNMGWSTVLAATPFSTAPQVSPGPGGAALVSWVAGQAHASRVWGTTIEAPQLIPAGAQFDSVMSAQTAFFSDGQAVSVVDGYVTATSEWQLVGSELK